MPGIFVKYPSTPKRGTLFRYFPKYTKESWELRAKKLKSNGVYFADGGQDGIDQVKNEKLAVRRASRKNYYIATKKSRAAKAKAKAKTKAKAKAKTKTKTKAKKPRTAKAKTKAKKTRAVKAKTKTKKPRAKKIKQEQNIPVPLISDQ